MPTVAPVPFDHPDAEALRAAQRAELAARYGTPDSEPGPAPTAADTTVFLLARDADGTPVGCGALRALDSGTGEVKRMFVIPARRRGGVASAVLAALEAEAARRGWTQLKLETGTEQPDAMAFYERHGYRRIPNFGHYAGSELSVCYARPLGATAEPTNGTLVGEEPTGMPFVGGMGSQAAGSIAGGVVLTGILRAPVPACAPATRTVSTPAS